LFFWLPCYKKANVYDNECGKPALFSRAKQHVVGVVFAAFDANAKHGHIDYAVYRVGGGLGEYYTPLPNFNSHRFGFGKYTEWGAY